MKNLNGTTTEYFNLLGVETPEKLRIWRKGEGRFIETGAEAPKGWGVGYAINGAYKAAEVLECRALVHENDDGRPVEDLMEDWRKLRLPLEPTFQVFTGNKSIHSYWVLEQPISPEKWKELQRGLYEQLGGDSSLQDLGQVMRVPGYPHPKTGLEAEIISQSGTRYDLVTVEAALGGAKREPKPAPETTYSMDPALESAIAFLADAWGPYVPGQGTYPDRLKIAAILKDTEGGLAAWTRHFGDEGLGRPNAQALFESIKGEGDHAGPGSIIFLAKEEGWEHPALNAESLKEAIKHAGELNLDEMEDLAERLPGRTNSNLKKLKAAASKQRIQTAKGIKAICLVSDSGQIVAPSDLVAAEWLSKEWKDRYRWDPDQNLLYRWTGDRWTLSNKAQLTLDVRHALEPINHLVSIRYMSAIVDCLSIDSSKILESEKIGIGFKNGFVKEGDFLPHSPDNLNRTVLPFDYDPDADCPRFKQWLSEVQSHTASQQALVAILRCCLVGKPSKLQILAEITGVSRSGKSTFVKICQALAGLDNTHATDPGAIENGQFSLWPLIGKKLILLQDVGKYNGELNRLKALTGGDTLSAEKKYQNDHIRLSFGGLVLVTGEHTLKSSDYQSGLNRRRFQIAFQNRVDQTATEDLIEIEGREVKGILAEELPGIVNYVLEMSEAECLEILSNPQKLKEQDPGWYEEQLIEQNPLVGWVKDNCETDPEVFTPTGDLKAPGLYQDYYDWAISKGLQPLGVQRFSRDLIDTLQNTLGHAVSRHRQGQGGKRGIKGLRLSARS